VVALALAIGFAGPALAIESGWTPPAWSAPQPPPITAKGAIVYDATAGTPLLAQNADEPLPPASVTKIVTAMVVLEHGNFDDVVEIVPEDVVDDSQSRVGLVAGDRLSVRDLFVGLLVPSGNDAALALARHVGAGLPGGNENPMAAFVAEMNAWATENGATNATFENPTGMSSEGQRASARDLALLTTVAMREPQFAETVATARAALPSTVLPEGYPVFSTNDMLVDGTAIGVKTGTLPEAGGCVVIATRMSGNLVVSVVLGSELVVDDATGNLSSPARYADTKVMLAAAAERYEWIDPSAPGAVPGLVDELSAWNAALASPGAIPAPVDRVGELSYRLQLGPPVDPGAPVGTVLFFVGPDMLARRSVEQAESGSGLAAAAD
jgi:D-alanyl-D-alanine carboxypeptidase (penicillin-binding protein 5/6)